MESLIGTKVRLIRERVSEVGGARKVAQGLPGGKLDDSTLSLGLWGGKVMGNPEVNGGTGATVREQQRGIGNKVGRKGWTTERDRKQGPGNMDLGRIEECDRDERLSPLLPSLHPHWAQGPSRASSPLSYQLLQQQLHCLTSFVAAGNMI